VIKWGAGSLNIILISKTPFLLFSQPPLANTFPPWAQAVHFPFSHSLCKGGWLHFLNVICYLSFWVIFVFMISQLLYPPLYEISRFQRNSCSLSLSYTVSESLQILIFNQYW
jgi:hypothetical protein